MVFQHYGLLPHRSVIDNAAWGLEVQGVDRDARYAKVREVLALVGLMGWEDRFPTELSGGMQQRVMIAMAIASRPDLLILDEPTTALDVTVQNQILDLIMQLKRKMGVSILFISHDLRIMLGFADRIAVMYAGVIVEEATREILFSRPGHPYTIGLIDSIPSVRRRKRRFKTIDGRMPLFSDLPQGCKFYPRCKFKMDECLQEEPELDDLSYGHISRCIRSKDLMSNGAIKDSQS